MAVTRRTTADEQGYIYVAGEAAFTLDNRDVQQIAGRPVAPYAGRDDAVLVVAPDMRSRMTWTTWSAGGSPSHSTMVNGIAAAHGVAAMAATARQGQLITVSPLGGQASPSSTLQASNPDGFFSVWPGYTQP